jgi:hypothetical protein
VETLPLAAVLGMIDECSQDGSADHQRQQSRQYLNSDDVRFLCLKRAEFVS